LMGVEGPADVEEEAIFEIVMSTVYYFTKDVKYQLSTTTRILIMAVRIE
jgi:hypothetical protein